MQQHELAERVAQIGRFEQALGRLIISWNDVEFRLVWLLVMLLKQEARPLSIITAQMTAEGKLHVIRACLSEMADTPETSLIEHACEYADRLRVWRNFYAHSINGVYETHNPHVQTTAYSLKARGKVVEKLVPVTEQDLIRVSSQCLELVNFIGMLNVVICHKAVASQSGKPVELPAPPPLPQSWEDYLRAQRSTAHASRPSPG